MDYWGFCLFVLVLVFVAGGAESTQLTWPMNATADVKIKSCKLKGIFTNTMFIKILSAYGTLHHDILTCWSRVLCLKIITLRQVHFNRIFVHPVSHVDPKTRASPLISLPVHSDHLSDATHAHWSGRHFPLLSSGGCFWSSLPPSTAASVLSPLYSHAHGERVWE